MAFRCPRFATSANAPQLHCSGVPIHLINEIRAPGGILVDSQGWSVFVFGNEVTSSLV